MGALAILGAVAQLSITAAVVIGGVAAIIAGFALLDISQRW